jgi:hypothetical protein
MTFDSDDYSRRHDTRRSAIYREFNFADEIIKIYDLRGRKKELLEEIATIDNKIQAVRNGLPEEVVELFERRLTADKLKGEE